MDLRSNRFCHSFYSYHCVLVKLPWPSQGSFLCKGYLFWSLAPRGPWAATISTLRVYRPGTWQAGRRPEAIRLSAVAEAWGRGSAGGSYLSPHSPPAARSALAPSGTTLYREAVPARVGWGACESGGQRALGASLAPRAARCSSLPSPPGVARRLRAPWPGRRFSREMGSKPRAAVFPWELSAPGIRREWSLPPNCS